jgi:hypothetical protein
VDEFKRVIHSKEKNEGKGLQVASLFFAIPVFSLTYSAIQNQSLGSLFGAVGFLSVVVLLFVMGLYQSV